MDHTVNANFNWYCKNNWKTRDKKKMEQMSKIDKTMAHSHNNSILLEPKQKGNIIWKFENAVNIEIACNVPGHYQAGMIAKVNIN